MIDPVDFYRLAESLLRWPSAREEHYRTAISRAYYAAFLAWREFAISSDRMMAERLRRSRSVHRNLIEWIRERDRGTGDTMSWLFKQRKRSDYDIYYRISRQDAERALENARKALERLPR
ncbi:MAG: HEPN domain-containing protein [Nitrososphaeria archaeon]